jgi:uncharacterized damage-inducible protein DinB/catechol 2,3-dioxygenase-like lactoylglutathione lyase family enzyme
MNHLSTLVAYTQWANRAWVRFMAEHGNSDEWLWQRISHVLLGERAWFQRIQGHEPDRDIWARLALPQIEQLLEAHARTYAGHLAGDLTREIDFQRFSGEKGRLPVADILLHLTVHGAHHRGQMATHASAIGLTPINTDFVQYCLVRERCEERRSAMSQIARVIPQLRTTNMDVAIEFYTAALGFTLEFLHDDFYAGVRAGEFMLHLKRVDERDPSIDYVEHGDHLHLYIETPDVAAVAAELRGKGVPFVRGLHDTAWNTRECIVSDPDGHTIYFGQPL